MNGQRGKLEMTPVIAATTWHGMSLPPDQPLPASPPEKPKLSAEERRIRQEDRLPSIRLRMAIGQALGMPAAEANKLLTRRQWRDGDVELLEAAAARLGVQVPGDE